MSIVIVNNKMSRPIGYAEIVSTKPRVQRPAFLKPGANELDLEKFEAATKNSPVWKKWIEDGDVEVTKGGEESGLAHLSPKDAKALVSDTFDIDLLASWEHNEKRADVAKAIRARSKKLEEEFNKGAKDSNT